jgi:dTDP-4-amino-4,6-dideoxygalactose transaminase
MSTIKLFQPYISQEARDNVQRVLSGTQIAQGPEVDLFEKEFAEKFGFEAWQIVSLNSGTSALELAYEIAELGEYDHVISPVLTCTATNIPLIRRKVQMSFGDIVGKQSLNMDVDDAENKILANTKAIVYVHFGGSTHNLDLFEDLTEDHGLDLICDAAQALGAPLSRKARFSCISLQAIKSLTAGDGGVLVCRDRDDAILARKLRWFGYDREEKQRLGDTDLDVAGYKMHMNDISAAIGRGNLAHWDEIIEHRHAINKIYSDYEDDNRPQRLIYGVWNPQVTGIGYLKAKEAAEKAGFEIGQHHYRNDKYSLFRSVYSNCPNMDALGDNYFLLPCHMGMTLADAEMIAKTIWPN